MRGGVKTIWCAPLLLILFACGTISYEEKVEFFHGAPVRSVLVLPLVNYSGVKNAETEINNIFASELRRYNWVRTYGRKEVYDYLRKKGIKKSPAFDRKTAYTLGRLFRVDAVVYGTLLSYMRPDTVSGSTYLSMNVRVIDVRNGRVTKAYTVSKEILPPLFSSIRKKFEKILNESISNMVADLLGGGESW